VNADRGSVSTPRSTRAPVPGYSLQVGLCPAILTVSRANRKLGDTFKLTGNAQFADSVMEFHFFVVTCRPWNAP
jgi:hypothetical protein